MQRQFEIYHINAFTKNPLEGNSAAVMFGDNLTEQQMQLIAHQTNYSETAFLISSSKADYKLRWFTPLNEVILCGHATIASLHFLSEKRLLKNNSSLFFETKSGNLKCSMSDDEYSIQMPYHPVEELIQHNNEIINAYNIPEEIIDSDTPILTLRNNYVFIKIKSYNKLISYKVNFNFRSEIINKYSDVSLYTTDTIEDENAAHQRFFAPGAGISEDPVTGSASAYLALVLLKSGLVTKTAIKNTITIEQGDHLGKRGRVKVSFDEEKRIILIKGNAVTFLKGKIFI
jgi:PhzF family phenazine biosynthesis protein